MKVTDPQVIFLILAACTISGTMCFLLGSSLQRMNNKREQLRLWSQAERLYRDRAILDSRDDAPLPKI